MMTSAVALAAQAGARAQLTEAQRNSPGASSAETAEEVLARRR